MADRSYSDVPPQYTLHVANRVFFANETIAITAGYRACATCLPDQFRAWKAAQHAPLVARTSSGQESGRLRQARSMSGRCQEG
jgi:methylphosphotriester-DNA--protein-cysteine methyltransferase